MWKEILKNSSRSTSSLLEYCELNSEVRCYNLLQGSDVNSKVKALDNSLNDFPVLVPPRWLQKIRKKDLQDPLLMQVLAQGEENIFAEFESIDPLSEADFLVCNGLLHKYKARVLIVTSGACPIHCRYCFRKNFPYSAQSLSLDNWQKIIDYLSTQDDIYEIILSGGDPLMLSNQRLTKMLDDIFSKTKIAKLRFHTRFATTIPERFDEGLWSLLSPYQEKIIWAWHINHVHELGEDLLPILARCRSLGMRVLSHTVLLRGINDKLDTLKDLYVGLDQLGIQAYYLFQMDQVKGSAHYVVPVSEGLELVASLRDSLPGYMVPRYVQEIPHKASKTLLL